MSYFADRAYRKNKEKSEEFNKLKLKAEHTILQLETKYNITNTIDCSEWDKADQRNYLYSIRIVTQELYKNWETQRRYLTSAFKMTI